MSPNTHGTGTGPVPPTPQEWQDYLHLVEWIEEKRARLGTRWTILHEEASSRLQDALLRTFGRKAWPRELGPWASAAFEKQLWKVRRFRRALSPGGDVEERTQMSPIQAAPNETSLVCVGVSWFRSRRKATLSLAVVLLGMAALKFVDSSWLGDLGQPIGYLTLSGLVVELSIAALLLWRFDRTAGAGLFLFGLGVVALTPLLPSCECLGPLELSRFERTVAGIVLGLLGAWLFLWPPRSHSSS